MTIEEMKERRRELGYSYQELADLCEMPLTTVQKIFGGMTKHPRRETIVKLERVLKKEHDDMPAYILRENAGTYHAEREDDLSDIGTPGNYIRQGTYTIEDYYRLPDEQRVELIDGVFYDMSAATSPHQIIGGEIHAQLLQFKKGKKGLCLPMIAAVDVQLDADNRTMVQPDVLILCDRSKLTRKGVVGAPDFVAEVLSPSTRKKDMTLKMQKYVNAGVREYWMIDPDKFQVIVYNLENLDFPTIYRFTDLIPVAVWGGECRIDLSETEELLKELFPD